MLTTAVLKVKDLIKGGTAGLKKTEEGSGEIL